MALTAYCKKCAREVDAGEVCPYCGTKLGKNAAHAAWCVERTPVKDWMSWNALMRILLPAALVILLLVLLAELIARHAEELDIDSWPDPKKVIMLQELRDMYYRFMKLSLQARKEADAKLPLEIKADIWYSPYIQISGFEEKAS